MERSPAACMTRGALFKDIGEQVGAAPNLDWQIGDPVPWGNPRRKQTAIEASPPAAQPSPAVEAPPPPAPARRKLSLAGKNSEVAADVLKDRLR
jgi:hypothetical protein